MTSAGTFFRQMGGTLGTAIFLSILFSAAHKIASAYQKAESTSSFKAAAAAHPDQLKTITSSTGSLNDTSFVQRLDKALAHPFLVGFSQAMDIVFLVGALVLVIAFGLSFMLKEVPLRRVSGIEAARAEAASTAESLADRPRDRPRERRRYPARPRSNPDGCAQGLMTGVICWGVASPAPA